MYIFDIWHTYDWYDTSYVYISFFLFYFHFYICVFWDISSNMFLSVFFSSYVCVFMYIFIMYFTFTLLFVCVAARKFYIYNTYMTYFSLSLSQMYVCVFQQRQFTEIIRIFVFVFVFHFHFLKCVSVAAETVALCQSRRLWAGEQT